jgi:hypothetical protein
MHKAPFDTLVEMIDSIQADRTLTPRDRQYTYNLARLVIEFAQSSMKGAGPAPGERSYGRREIVIGFAGESIHPPELRAAARTARIECPHCGGHIRVHVSCSEE